MITFLVLAGIGLLWGATMAPLNLLSVALAQNGMSAHDIGLVIAASNIAGIIAAFYAGSLIERLGPRRALLYAAGLALVGIGSMQLWPGSTPLAALSSFIRGCGGGFFLVAGVIMTRNTSARDQQIYRVGLFTSFVMLPTLVIPGLADRYLAAGTGWFFLWTALPALVAIPLISMLPVITPDRKQVASTPYRVLLRDRKIRLPCGIVAVTGVMYAFNTGFMALYLARQHIAVSAFFTAFVVLLLVSRFLFMKKLQTSPVLLLVALGMWFYTTPFYLALFPSPVMMAVAGGSFGLGYSIVYPTSMEWVCQQFDRADQSKLVSLINTSFQSGNVIGALFAGFSLALLSWFLTMVFLALLGIASLVVLLVFNTNRDTIRLVLKSGQT